MFERQSDRARKGEISYQVVHPSNVCNCQGCARLKPGTRHSILFPCMCGRAKYLSHHEVPLKVHVSRKLNCNQRKGFDLSIPTFNVDIPKSYLSVVPQCLFQSFQNFQYFLYAGLLFSPHKLEQSVALRC